ncbi:MAG: PqqD family protein [Acidobacteriota bacterium]|nr:PqqD family protein [Acidobacteriota bacterium]
MGRPSVDQVVDLLELEPVRCVPWQENVDGNVIIDRPQPPLDGLRGLIERANWLVTPRRIRLDDLGSFAWRRLDGVTKVRTLAGVMHETFPDSRHQIEERLGVYLRAMRRLRVIDFPHMEDPR